jgi:outer membrane immunogenic protein
MKTRILGLLAATALSVAGVSAASAADLPVRSAPPAPVFAPVPVFTWIGYNYQIGSFVVGLEGDIQYADFGREGVFNFRDEQGNLFEGELESSDWFGTVRARAGVAFGQALIYGTGGFAFADDATGWTAGGGVEYAFTNNLSAKIEALYVSLDADNNNDFDFDNDVDFGVVRAGLNFRFGTY